MAAKNDIRDQLCILENLSDNQSIFGTIFIQKEKLFEYGG